MKILYPKAKKRKFFPKKDWLRRKTYKIDFLSKLIAIFGGSHMGSLSALMMVSLVFLLYIIMLDHRAFSDPAFSAVFFFNIKMLGISLAIRWIRSIVRHHHITSSSWRGFLSSGLSGFKKLIEFLENVILVIKYEIIPARWSDKLLEITYLFLS